jgi:hypothetical protein
MNSPGGSLELGREGSAIAPVTSRLAPTVSVRHQDAPTTRCELGSKCMTLAMD